MSERSSHPIDVMVEFLKERVAAQQGISLERLTGHLSQLPPELRTKYGCSAKSLTTFLQKFPDIFIIRNDANVYVETGDRQASSPLNGSAGSFNASALDSDANEIDVPCLTDVTGTVYRVFDLYGFISIQSPVKASIYFDAQSFENAQYTSLPSSGLRMGDKVIFDAGKGPKHCKAKYRASRVARATTTEELFLSPGLSPDNANDGAMSDCNAFSHLFDQYGVVEHVKASYGFIKFGFHDSERAFFHRNNVDKLIRKWIKNIPDAFSVGDLVRFNAKLSMKPSEQVKWEATTVHLCRSTNNDGPVDQQDPNDNEVYISDDEFDLDDLARAKLDDYQSGEAGFTGFPAGYTDWDESLLKADAGNSVNNQIEAAQKPFAQGEPGPRDCYGPEESGQRLKGDGKDRENSLCFEDFEAGIEQADEAAHGPSRVPSETVVPQKMVPIRERVVNNSVSVAGFLAAANDKVRIRLAEMVAAKIVSANQSFRAVLRDVGVQTVVEKLPMVPKSMPGDLVPAHTRSSSSTQTTSTGDIKSTELFIS